MAACFPDTGFGITPPPGTTHWPAIKKWSRPGKVRFTRLDKFESTAWRLESFDLVDMLAALEKEMLKNAMRHCKSTREMSRFLNISQPTVVRKLKKHSLPPPMIQT
jgi:DNA-binding NtrC family response regulator